MREVKQPDKYILEELLEKPNDYCNWKNWSAKTWKESDKQHLIFLHSHCELGQDNKDQLEPLEGFMAENNWQAFSVSSSSHRRRSRKLMWCHARA